MSNLFKGENNPFFNKTHTKDTRIKISKNRKGLLCGEDH